MAGFNRETSMGEDVERKVCILGYLMKCGKKSSGKMSKDTKRKSVLTL